MQPPNVRIETVMEFATLTQTLINIKNEINITEFNVDSINYWRWHLDDLKMELANLEHRFDSITHTSSQLPSFVSLFSSHQPSSVIPVGAVPVSSSSSSSVSGNWLMELPDDRRREKFVEIYYEVEREFLGREAGGLGLDPYYWDAVNNSLQAGTVVLERGTFDIPTLKPSPYVSIEFSPNAPKVEFTVGDMLDEAKSWIDKHNDWKVTILNMASAHHPGGGVKRGALNAQEEDISRRTNLMMSLSPEFNTNLWKGKHYEIPDKGAIWSPGVKVMRKSRYENYERIPIHDNFEVNVISSAAVNLNKPGSYRSHDRWMATMVPRAKTLFSLAVSSPNGKTDVLILGPWGAGAFGADPKWVGELYAYIYIDIWGQGGDVGKSPIPYSDLKHIVIMSINPDQLEKVHQGWLETLQRFNLSVS